MSHDQRAALHALAAGAGVSTVRYLLELALKDAADRCAYVEHAALATTLSEAEEPGPNRDRAPDAKAVRAVAAAAG